MPSESSSELPVNKPKEKTKPNLFSDILQSDKPSWKAVDKAKDKNDTFSTSDTAAAKDKSKADDHKQAFDAYNDSQEKARGYSESVARSGLDFAGKSDLDYDFSAGNFDELDRNASVRNSYKDSFAGKETRDSDISSIFNLNSEKSPIGEVYKSGIAAGSHVTSSVFESYSESHRSTDNAHTHAHAHTHAEKGANGLRANAPGKNDEKRGSSFFNNNYAPEPERNGDSKDDGSIPGGDKFGGKDTAIFGGKLSDFDERMSAGDYSLRNEGSNGTSHSNKSSILSSSVLNSGLKANQNTPLNTENATKGQGTGAFSSSDKHKSPTSSSSEISSSGQKTVVKPPSSNDGNHDATANNKKRLLLAHRRRLRATRRLAEVKVRRVRLLQHRR
jgi:hypothetical protein